MTVNNPNYEDYIDLLGFAGDNLRAAENIGARPIQALRRAIQRCEQAILLIEESNKPKAAEQEVTRSIISNWRGASHAA